MFSRNNKSYAKAIELKEWQNHVEDVASIFSERKCNVYFYVRDSNIIGKLSFEGAWAFRSVRTEVDPYVDSECDFSSYILEVFNSSWPSEIEFGFYTKFSKMNLHNESKHYLVKGHDIYHEILCQKYNETYINENDEEYKYALWLLDNKP